ncbi:polynucleotide kinase 3 phosphatase-domain-containing protein [Endogone sp. FLAS-F59071]|nr:polynucleotide kinase 3 phosphatase-domain-containing protein [Endogone sp. FLAS-F59071]|eukprot:RUS20191.1 polynucleotide kinase 3 phosphatase-domain-containing protein [Endogone sp. FLAS-F59071]
MDKFVIRDKGTAVYLYNSVKNLLQPTPTTMIRNNRAAISTKITTTSASKTVSKRKANNEESQEELEVAIEKKVKITQTTTSTSSSIHPFFSQSVSATTSTSTHMQMIWIQKSDGFLIGSFNNPLGRAKIAAFDLDSTLIATKSGNVHPKDAHDWKWWHHSVPKNLRELDESGYKLVLITNQAGLKNSTKLNAFKTKVTNVLSGLALPAQILISTQVDQYRKPLTGGWEWLRDEGNDGVKIGRSFLGKGITENESCSYETGSIMLVADSYLEQSFYVGDAAGRLAGWKAGHKKDFSCTDRKFAENLSLTFHIPEEFFLGEPKAAFDWGGFEPKKLPKNSPLFTPTTTSLVPDDRHQEVVVLVGYPACGKSQFASRWLVPKGYVYVNQDTLKTKDKCVAAATKAVKEGKSVVIDNTNPDSVTRSAYIDLAKSHHIPARCFWFVAPEALARHNNAYRALRKIGGNENKREMVPGMAYNVYNGKFKEPEVGEGFVEVKKVNFVWDGEEEEKKEWERWWY